MYQDVRRSIARIHFDWQKKKGKEVMVIPGVILSIEDGLATILAHAAFFKQNLDRCVINFPKADGYEDEIVLENLRPHNKDHFCTFTVTTNGASYTEPVKFETQAVIVRQDVNAFVFPRERLIAEAGYPYGFILTTSAEYGYFAFDCKMHEYGYFESPVFNLRGHLIGITFLDIGLYQAYSVLGLQKGIIKGKNCDFVSNGGPMEAPPTA